MNYPLCLELHQIVRSTDSTSSYLCDYTKRDSYRILEYLWKCDGKGLRIILKLRESFLAHEIQKFDLFFSMIHPRFEKVVFLNIFQAIRFFSHLSLVTGSDMDARSVCGFGGHPKLSSRW